MLRLLLLLAAGVVVSESSISVATCDRSVCSCPAPNGDLGDVVMAKDANDAPCACACGREEGTECTTDDHCAQGTSCRLRKDLGQGDQLTCINKCSTTKCKQYETCSLVDNEPTCQCFTYTCDPLVTAPVVGVRGNEMQTFGNRCEVVSENCRQAMFNANSIPWNM